MRVKCLFAVISGSLFALGFAPFSLWPLSLFSVFVLIHLMEGMGKKESFIIGFLYGVGYWLIGISWVYVSIHYHGNINELSSSLITLLFISRPWRGFGDRVLLFISKPGGGSRGQN